MFSKLRYIKIYTFSFFYSLWLKSIGVKIGKNNIFLARLDIRGNPKNIIIGDNGVFQTNICLNTIKYQSSFGKIYIGQNCLVADGVIISSSDLIEIHNNVEIAARSYLVDHDHNTLFTTSKPKKIIIQNNVWIGTGCTILKGVEIGVDSVIGANSLVSKNVRPTSLGLGNPFKVIKRFEINE